MGLLSKMCSLFKVGGRKIEDAIDDNYGAEIYEQRIVDAENKIEKAKASLLKHEAYINVESAEIEQMNADIESYTKELSVQKELHDKAESPEQKSKHIELAKKIKAEIEKIQSVNKPKIDAYEMAKDAIEDNQAIIEEQEKEIEIARLEIETVKSSQAAINLHKDVDGITSGLKGNGVNKGDLAKTKRKQQEELELIKLKRSNKQAGKVSLSDEIEKSKKDDSDPFSL